MLLQLEEIAVKGESRKNELIDVARKYHTIAPGTTLMFSNKFEDVRSLGFIQEAH